MGHTRYTVLSSVGLTGPLSDFSILKTNHPTEPSPSFFIKAKGLSNKWIQLGEVKEEKFLEETKNLGWQKEFTTRSLKRLCKFLLKYDLVGTANFLVKEEL